MNTTKKESCEVCYKIICKQCQWEASEEDIVKIQKHDITACPLCGWAPDDIL